MQDPINKANLSRAHHASKLLCMALVVLSAPGIVLGAATVSNVNAVQVQDGTGAVRITYDLANPGGEPVYIGVEGSADSGATWTVPVNTLSGNGWGQGVTPGTGKVIVWDAQADWPGQVSATMRFRVTASGTPPAPSGMALIPAGSFEMGDAFSEGSTRERPVHSVYVSAFYMDKYEVTNDAMVEVMTWAYQRGKLVVSSSSVMNAEGDQQELLDLNDSDCRITWDGSSFGLKPAKGSGYPCLEVTWYGAAAYSNYRSEMEGLEPCYDLSDWSCDFSASGYRLPTEAEWEKAARGGLSGKRFPWGDTISHSQANYYSYGFYSYDESPTRGFHPDWDDGGYPYTSPVGSFAPNDYGLYDMAGNVWEWCNDWYSSSYYASSPSSDPPGPPSGSHRVLRGGGWGYDAINCRVANRDSYFPSLSRDFIGFRCVRR